MAKRQSKTSGRISRSGNGRRRKDQDQQTAPAVSETLNRVARTGGSDRAMTLAEDREARANAASGHGQVLGRAVATQPQPKPKASPEVLAKGTPRPKQAEPSMQVTAPIDHGALNHVREKAPNQAVRSEVGGQRSEARGSTPWPQDITQMSEQDAAEAIRTTDKADILYKWRNDERLSGEPRQSVVSLIYEKLLRVQGPPLPPE